jgi:hypothetical protein
MVDASLFTKCFMDHLINFMNNSHLYSLSLFHLPLITNLVTSHIHFSTPCSKIDYSQENLCVKKDEGGSVLCGLLLSLSSDHVFSPSLYHIFA